VAYDAPDFIPYRYFRVGFSTERKIKTGTIPPETVVETVKIPGPGKLVDFFVRVTGAGARDDIMLAIIADADAIESIGLDYILDHFTDATPNFQKLVDDPTANVYAAQITVPAEFADEIYGRIYNASTTNTYSYVMWIRVVRVLEFGV